MISSLPCGAGILSVEPFTEAHDALKQWELKDLLSVTDIFSPNLAEAASMLGMDCRLTSDRCFVRACVLTDTNDEPIEFPF